MLCSALFEKGTPLAGSSLQKVIELRHDNSNNVVCAISKGSDQPAHTRCLLRSSASRLSAV